MKRILSLIIALVMALGVFACAEDASQGTVLMTVDDEKVYQDQVQEIAELLYQYGYTNSVNMTLGLKYVLLNQVAPFLLTRGQEAELLGEERFSELKETYTNEFNDYFESYVESLAGENDTEEDKAAHRAERL